MRIRLNGEDREVTPGLDVEHLLEQLGLKRDGIAVALDSRVVPKSAYARTPLSEGCVVEVIRAVGGG